MKKKISLKLLVVCFCLASLTSKSDCFGKDSESQMPPKTVPAISTKNLDLGQLFRYYGSDKDSNGYSSAYHTLFDHLREKPVRVLEIGIGTMIPGAHSSMVGYGGQGYRPGGSLRAWRDYFVKGTIYGVDVQQDTQFNDESRITTYICNSTDKTQVDEFMKKLGNIKFDIILDDGSHFDVDQKKTLSNFYPYLKDSGIYIIEDIYPNGSLSTNPDTISKLCNGDPLFFVGVKNNACVIYKKHLIREGDSYKY